MVYEEKSGEQDPNKLDSFERNFSGCVLKFAYRASLPAHTREESESIIDASRRAGIGFFDVAGRTDSVSWH